MTRLMRVSCGIALALAGVVAPATAQGPSLFFGLGPTLPTGEYNDYAKAGWLAAAGVTKALQGQRVWLGAEGVYGQNSHDDIDGDKTNLYGANGLVGINFSGSDQPGFYVYGGLGLLVHKYSPETGEGESDSAFAYSGALGYVIPLPAIDLWLEARYYKRKDTAFIPFMVGISVGGGGGNNN